MLIKFIYMIKIHLKQTSIFSINKSDSTGLKHLKDSKTFVEYLNDMDIYKNIEEYSPSQKNIILLVFDMIADMLSNKELKPIIIELFIKGRKLYIFLVFIA